MPKEHIYSDRFPYEETSAARSVIEVSWSREANHVKLATKCIRADDETVFEDPSIPTLSAADGWHIDLDRKSINELIRKLRRARDQAFGRDE